MSNMKCLYILCFCISTLQAMEGSSSQAMKDSSSHFKDKSQIESGVNQASNEDETVFIALTSQDPHIELPPFVVSRVVASRFYPIESMINDEIKDEGAAYPLPIYDSLNYPEQSFQSYVALSESMVDAGDSITKIPNFAFQIQKQQSEVKSNNQVSILTDMLFLANFLHDTRIFDRAMKELISATAHDPDLFLHMRDDLKEPIYEYLYDNQICFRYLQNLYVASAINLSGLRKTLVSDDTMKLNGFSWNHDTTEFAWGSFRAKERWWLILKTSCSNDRISSKIVSGLLPTSKNAPPSLYFNKYVEWFSKNKILTIFARENGANNTAYPVCPIKENEQFRITKLENGYNTTFQEKKDKFENRFRKEIFRNRVIVCMTFNPSDDTKYAIVRKYEYPKLTETILGTMEYKENFNKSKIASEAVIFDDEPVTTLSWNSSGSILACGREDNKISLYFLDSEDIEDMETSSPVHAITWNRAGTQCAAGLIDNTIEIFDVVSKQKIKTLIQHDTPKKPIVSLAYNQDDHLLAGTDSSTISIWDIYDAADAVEIQQPIATIETPSCTQSDKCFQVSWAKPGNLLTLALRSKVMVMDLGLNDLQKKELLESCKKLSSLEEIASIVSYYQAYIHHKKLNWNESPQLQQVYSCFVPKIKNCMPNLNEKGVPLLNAAQQMMAPERSNWRTRLNGWVQKFQYFWTPERKKVAFGTAVCLTGAVTLGYLYKKYTKAAKK